jgi:hypothetical protein
MRTFVRVSLLGNALLDLACILLLLSHGRGNQPRDAALSLKPAEAQATVHHSNPIGVFAVEAPLAQGERPASYPAGLWDGNTMLADLVQLEGIPRYLTAYGAGWLNWRLEGKPLYLRPGEGAYSGLSP